jgi:hypothetical protein
LLVVHVYVVFSCLRFGRTVERLRSLTAFTIW